MYKFLVVFIFLTGFCYSQAPPFRPDPYDNPYKEIFQDYLPVSGYGNIKEPLLPRIVYAYLPDGNLLQNLGGDSAIGKAPDIGAVEAIVLFLYQCFACKGFAREAGKVFWATMIYASFVGLMFSGWMIFKEISMGAKGIGEGLMNIFFKVFVVIFCLFGVAPNLPPILIGICNALTVHLDSWGVIDGSGASSSKEKTDIINSLYRIKMASAVASAANLATLMADAATRAAGGDPVMSEAVARAIQKIQNDERFQTAIGKDGKIWDGAKSLRISPNASVRDISTKISEASLVPYTVVVEVFNQHLGEELSKNAPEEVHKIVMEAVNRAALEMDVRRYALPGRLIAFAAYVSFAFLGISIWGLGFGMVIWAFLYSLPEQLNFSQILYSGFRMIMGVILAIFLITIYISASLVVNFHSTERMKKETVDALNYQMAYYSSVGSSNFSFYDPILAGLSLEFFQRLWGGGVGQIHSIISSEMSQNSIEQFILVLLILTAPAQAAAILQGANGIGENASKAIEGKAAATGGIKSALGIWGRSSGATASENFSAHSIMTSRSRHELFRR